MKTTMREKVKARSKTEKDADHARENAKISIHQTQSFFKKKVKEHVVTV